jgi:DNA-directed RNA polymerase subunit L
VKLRERIVGLLLAGAIAAALLGYVFGKIDAFLSARDQIVTDSSRAMLKIHGASVRLSEQLRAAERRNQQLAGEAHGLANELRAALARGERVDTVQVLVEIARQDSTSYAKCSVALLTCQQRADSAEREAGRLAKQLERQLTVRDHRCGIFAGVGPTLYADGGEMRGRLLAVNLSLGCRISRLPWPF